MTNERNLYVEESLQWLPGPATGFPQLLPPPPDRTGSPASPANTASDSWFLVLLADDNADMRNYVGRLLPDNYDLITATNGEEAFEKYCPAPPIWFSPIS